MKMLKTLSLGLGMACLLLTIPQVNAQAPKKAKEKKEKAQKEAAPTGPVDINTGSAAELEAIKGIGPATSKKIIAGRPYASIADLSKAGLTAKQVAEFTPMLKVSAMPAAAKAAPSAAAAPTAAAAPPAAAKNMPTPAATAAPGGGPGMVWVNTESKVFHLPGDRWYGKTKEGKYMTQTDAVKAGFRESKEKVKGN